MLFPQRGATMVMSENSAKPLTCARTQAHIRTHTYNPRRAPLRPGQEGDRVRVPRRRIRARRRRGGVPHEHTRRPRARRAAEGALAGVVALFPWGGGLTLGGSVAPAPPPSSKPFLAPPKKPLSPHFIFIFFLFIFGSSILYFNFAGQRMLLTEETRIGIFIFICARRIPRTNCF